MPKAVAADSAAARDLANCLSAELFIPQLASQTKDDVLTEMVDALVTAGRVRNRQLLLETLERRESLGSTAIGKGVALPHGRSLAVRELVVVVGRSVDGIAFGAADEKPVHHIFLIAAPPHDPGNKYLAVLARLVDLVKDAASRRRLAKVETFDQFLACVEAHHFDG